MTTKHPNWWTNEDDSAWGRVKEAFHRDWEQTKHDFGSKTAPDLDQDVGDTVKQMAGKEDPRHPVTSRSFDEAEPAYSYGYSARRHYGDNLSADQQDARWREEWTAMGRNDYDQYRDDIRRGWEYNGG